MKNFRRILCYILIMAILSSTIVPVDAAATAVSSAPTKPSEISADIIPENSNQSVLDSSSISPTLSEDFSESTPNQNADEEAIIEPASQSEESQAADSYEQINYNDQIQTASQSIISGICGAEDNEEAVQWSFDPSSGHLSITGSGEMYQGMYGFLYTIPPWEEFLSNILSVSISEGITSIAGGAFANCVNLTDVSIPDTVTEIEGYAFWKCSSLEYIVLPDSSFLSGEYTFAKCSVLKEVNIPTAQTTITSYMFYECRSLTNIVIPEGVSCIGPYAFSYCSSLESINIPDHLEYIGEHAFNSCNSLTSVTIPASVTEIGTGAFSRCTSLTGIWVDSGNDYFVSSPEGILFDAEGTTLMQVPGAKRGTYQIPNGIMEILGYAFAGCEKITGITISSNVTSIGEYAFLDCNGLTRMIIPKNVTSLETGIFSRCKNLVTAEFQYNYSEIPDYTFEECYNLVNFTIPSNVTRIGDSAFDGCLKLDNIIIPSGVTTIGDDAFNRSSLQSGIALPEGLISIGRSCFWYCDFESIVIPKGITEIAPYTFAFCSNLTEIILPNGLKTIGYSAFTNCEQLSSIVLPTTVSELGSEVFEDCFALTEIYFRGKAPYFEGDVFSNVTSTAYYPEDNASWTGDVLQDYGGTIEWVPYTPDLSGDDEIASGICGDDLTWVLNADGVLTISGTGAMDDYDYEDTPWYEVSDQIQTVTFEEGVTSIGNYAFYDLPELMRLRLCESMVSIGISAFENCDSLINVAIYKGVITIDDYAFADCSNLMTVNFLGDSLSIGSEAFLNCDKLEEIHFWNDAPTISDDAFYGVTATAYYPPDNESWTEDMMQDYGGNLVWETELTDEDACLMNELTDADYLAFSEIAYLNLEYGLTVKQNLIKLGYWDWDNIWSEDQNIFYPELCAHIAQWKVVNLHNLSNYNGFYAVAFENENEDVVLAYRGSVPLDNMKGQTWDAFCDWLLNDLPLELGNTMGPQFDSALEIYNALNRDASRITVTGHSLGGAWADTVSAYTGCRGITFNAVSILDVLYKHDPVKMSRVFDGVERWNFVDHTNQYDVLAGMFEHYLSKEMKPYIAHNSNVAISPSVIEAIVGGTIGSMTGGSTGAVVGTVVGSVGLDVVKCHGLDSFVTKDSDGTVTLTAEVSGFTPQKSITNYMFTANHSVDFGTTKNDTLNDAWTLTVPRTSYGGNGNDKIFTSWQDDAIIGGADNSKDELDGSWGNDTYYYYIGDGYDIIWDVSGKDILEICGTTSDDVIDFIVNDETNMVDIYCNDELIVSIYNQNRAEADNSFRINWGAKTTSITAELRTREYSASMNINCPVDIQILDNCENVVFTLEDGVTGNYYTEYGNFYVYEEEDGGFGKVLDLVEGYSVQIVGVDTGTMDISYREIESGTPSEIKTVTDVPVTSEFSAVIEKDAKNKLILSVDTDGDSVPDESIKFEGESTYGNSIASGDLGSDLEWNVYDSGVLFITGDGAIPDFNYDWESDCFDRPWDAYTDSITSVVIDEGITYIGSLAFYSMNLTHLAIPSTVTDVGSQALSSLYELTEITVAEGNPSYCSVDGVLFNADVTKLILYPAHKGETEYEIPTTVTCIGEMAIADNQDLLYITLPEGLTTLEAYAFESCQMLTSVDISSTVSEIGYDAFSYCGQLEEFTVATDNRWYTSVDGVLFDKTMERLICCPDTLYGHYVIPNGVRIIEDAAFADCSKLTEITIPDSVERIGTEAFAFCSSLSEILIPESVMLLDYYAFMDAYSLEQITVLNPYCRIESGAFETYGETVIVGYDESTAQAYAEEYGMRFESLGSWPGTIGGTYGSNLTWVMDNEGTMTISGIGDMENQNYHKYYPWHGLNTTVKKLIIEEGVTSISQFAFYDFSNLTEVIFPDGLLTIGKSAFWSCDSLSSITLPASVQEIEPAFQNCDALEYIRVDKSSKYFCSDGVAIYSADMTRIVFLSPAYEGTFEIPDSVTSIGNYAFCNNSRLTGITLPESITFIGNYAFANCVNLTTVNLPGWLTTIGEGVFMGCSTLKTIEIPESVTHIKGYAFYQCSGLAEVTFKGDAPEFSAYENNPSLGSMAFYGVTATAYYPAGNTTWTADKMQNYGGNILWKKITTGEIHGDLNSDGFVNEDDVIYLLWHTLFPEDYVIFGDADFNHDSKTDEDDVIYLLWHTLFPEDYPL